MSEQLDAWRERALAVGCAALVDAMMRHHEHKADLPALRSPAPERPLFVPAVTMQFLPTRDDLPGKDRGFGDVFDDAVRDAPARSEEHTSELQSRENLVCRLLLEKKKKSK